MRIGIATTDFTTLPGNVLLDRIKGYGFEAVQLSLADVAEVGFVPNGEIEIPEILDPAAVAQVGRQARGRRLPLVALNGTFNMAHPDPAVRKEGLRRLEGLARAANALEVPLVTLCSGTRNRAHLWRPHPDNVTQEAWQDMMDTMEQAAGLAERYELTLAIETEAANVIDTPEKARAALDALGSPRVKMVLDGANLFHAGRAKPEYVEETLRHAFDLFGRDVVIAHGKDIRASEGIDFCTTGQGILDFPLMLQLLRTHGDCDMILHGIEQEAQMPGALAFMRNLRYAV